MTTEQPTIESMNRLIAEFMGFDIAGNMQWIESERKEGRMIERPGTIDDLKYHLDWNILMEVVEKINHIPYTKHFFINGLFTGVHGIESGGQSIGRTIIKNPVEEKLIDSVHKSVYDYIVWHNNPKW